MPLRRTLAGRGVGVSVGVLVGKGVSVGPGRVAVGGAVGEASKTGVALALAEARVASTICSIWICSCGTKTISSGGLMAYLTWAMKLSTRQASLS